MSSVSPRDTYQALAINLRSRLDFAEHILANPFGRPLQTVETVSLQGRKCVEIMAFMMLVATEHAFGRANIPRDIRTQWSADPIFQRLKKKKLDLIPSPQRVSASNDPRYTWIIDGVAEHRLSYDNLIAIYRIFHVGLHEPNPYGQPIDDTYYASLISEIRKALTQIKNLTWRHMVFIKGHAFLCILSDDHGKVGVVSLDKTAELPDDVK
jgi:hypothetical protein